MAAVGKDGLRGLSAMSRISVWDRHQSGRMPMLTFQSPPSEGQVAESMQFVDSMAFDELNILHI